MPIRIAEPDVVFARYDLYHPWLRRVQIIEDRREGRQERVCFHRRILAHGVRGSATYVP